MESQLKECCWKWEPEGEWEGHDGQESIKDHKWLVTLGCWLQGANCVAAYWVWHSQIATRHKEIPNTKLCTLLLRWVAGCAQLYVIVHLHRLFLVVHCSFQCLFIWCCPLPESFRSPARFFSPDIFWLRDVWHRSLHQSADLKGSPLVSSPPQKGPAPVPLLSDCIRRG